MIERTFAVDGAPHVELSMASGSAVFESGPSGVVDIEIDTRRPDAWTITQSGRNIYVALDRASLRGGRDRVRIVLPERSDLSVQTASADVRAQLSLQQLMATTASGDVALEDASRASIKTASGDVRLRQIEGDLDVKSASGDLIGDEVVGKVAVTTASGDVFIRSVGGDVAVSTASGDVEVEEFLGDNFVAATMSGDIELGLPTGRTVRLDAKTLSGSVNLPPRRPASGSGGPTVDIRIKSVSGDVTLRRLD